MATLRQRCGNGFSVLPILKCVTKSLFSYSSLSTFLYKTVIFFSLVPFPLFPVPNSATGPAPQSTYRGRGEIGGVYMPSQLERTPHFCGKYSETGWAYTPSPPPHLRQAGLIFPSWCNVWQKVASATLCVLCAPPPPPSTLSLPVTPACCEMSAGLPEQLCTRQPAHFFAQPNIYEEEAAAILLAWKYKANLFGMYRYMQLSKLSIVNLKRIVWPDKICMRVIG